MNEQNTSMGYLKPATLLASVWCLLILNAGCGVSRGVNAGPMPQIDIHALAPYYARDVQRSYRELQSRPNDVECTERVASVFYYVKQSDQAVVWFNRLRQLDPRSSRSWFFLGLAQAEQKQVQSAAASFNNALRLDPNNSSVKLQLALAVLQLGEIEQSRTYFEDLIRRNPKDHYAYYGLGRVHSAQGDLAKAAQNYEKAIKLFPQFRECRQAVAHVLLRLSRHEEAEQQLALAEKISTQQQAWTDPINKSVETHLLTAGQWVLRGGQRIEAGDVLGALDANLTALNIDSSRYDARINLIALYAQVGEPERSRAAFEAAVATIRDREVAPTGPSCQNKTLAAKLAQVYFTYGTVLVQAGKAQSATQIYMEGLKKSPQDPDLNNAMGRIAEQQSHVQQAAAYYRQAISSKPDFAIAHFNLGRLLASTGNYDAAMTELLSAVSIHSPNQVQLLGQSLSIYTDAGKSEAMMRFLKQARSRFVRSNQIEMQAQVVHFSEILGLPTSL